MNSKITSSLDRRISTHAGHLIGGGGGRCAQFPNLHRLARDVLAIPGELFHFIPTVHVTKALY
jgi:hypothetical protein